MTADLASVGGKAANLIILRDAGIAVPAFVVLDTAEYRSFVAGTGLGPLIEDAVAQHDPAGASTLIRTAFRLPMRPAQRARIAAAIAPLADRPVAVRSSATAEDLPDLSFAGQQDTFLNVRGTDSILKAVVECWSSAWTERAITYRRHNAVTPDATGPTEGWQESLAVAVVVQEMVDAEASGVMFTADPLTGHRGHTVIDAVFGLGEALVSGQVTPDNLVVDTASGRILQRTTQGERPALSDGQASALTALGARIAQHYGEPQDIEWVRVGDDLQIVQTRAITSLFPLPRLGTDADAEAQTVWFSFGAFQGVLEPITPLGQDVLLSLIAGGARVFHHVVDFRTNPYVATAGERLWVRLDPLLRLPLVHGLTPRFLSIADPGAAAVAARLAQEPAFAPAAGLSPLVSARVVRTGARFVRPVLSRIPRSLARPESARAAVDHTAQALLEALAARLTAADTVTRPEQRLAARVRALESFAGTALADLLLVFGPIMASSVQLLDRLRTLARESGLPDAEALALGALRSLPGNVTTEMDLALYAVARTILDDPSSLSAFTDADPVALADDYLAESLPAGAQDALASFLDRYGMRGVAEIDLGAPRWRDHPDGVIRSVQSYLALDGDRAPDAAYERGRREAQADIERLASAFEARHQRVKAAQVRFLAGRLRGLMGARETPKFTMVKGFGMARAALSASARDLVAAGILDAPADVFYLHLDELRRAFGRADLRPSIAERKAAHGRESRRTRVPLVLVGDGRTYYEGFADAGDADLAGAGVSPGVVEGLVRVVHDPRTSELKPGEIMVCRGTDPAWTPLFLTASGLVTEVGGLMTHGSVVAREYGLPAVVGVGVATTTLRSGQRIRLDGTAGTITLL